ncbi:MAG: hypothetical protein HLUCCA08_04085 [Rhodobacteraceae bacterium HLUCCA08]|nr:MAG: hypothetical protein HLUCCA08_04085 [Rhodobacteraceae bacterium HLUCCA08]
MKRLTLALVLAAPAALAQEADPADIAAMVAAIEQAGCVVTMDNGDAVQQASGLGEDQIMAVIATLYGQGAIAMTEDGSVRLTTGACE